MKLTKKAKLLTEFRLLLQLYLIFQPLSILMDFQIIYFISSLFILQFFTMAVIHYLASYYYRYQSLSHSRLTKILTAIFYFSENVRLTQIAYIMSH